MTEKERYCLHTDITGNCFIVSNDCKFGMFDKLERSQVIRIIDELNSQNERIKELETKLSYYEPVPVKRKNGEDAILFEGEEYREYKCGDDVND